jgi:hypothetical protein
LTTALRDPRIGAFRNEGSPRMSEELRARINDLRERLLELGRYL